MVTQKDKYPCPVCGEMISAQGVAGHNRSKVHLAALEKQQEVKQTKVDTVKITKPKQEQQEPKKEQEYNGLEW
jgi:hypothetical protein